MKEVEKEDERGRERRFQRQRKMVSEVEKEKKFNMGRYDKGIEENDGEKQKKL